MIILWWACGTFDGDFLFTQHIEETNLESPLSVNETSQWTVTSEICKLT